MHVLKSDEYEKTLAEVAEVCEKCKVKNKVFDKKCKSCKTYEEAMSFRKAETCPNCGTDMDLREVVSSDNGRNTYLEHVAFYQIQRHAGEWFCPKCGKTQLNLSGFAGQE